MPWIQISFQATRDTASSLSDALTSAGALSVTMQDAKDQPLLEPGVGETPIWDQVIVTGLFPQGTAEQATLKKINHHWQAPNLPPHFFSVLEDKVWEREWMREFHPMRFGQRTWICPSWLPVPDADAVNILLDPGLAFGTGTHPTTALCLQWLDEHIKGGECVIDFGCGSGILSIAAAKLGATEIWAVDNDPQALTATNNNAESNDVQSLIHCVDAKQSLDVQADIIIANILANPLISLETLFKNLIKANGIAILSGILIEQSDSVVAAYQNDFILENRSILEDWSRLDFRRR